jgi:uncharacterized protein
MKAMFTLMLMLALPAIAVAAGANLPNPHTAHLPTAVDYGATLLPDRADVIPWKTLEQVTPSTEGGKIVPVFTDSILSLNKRDVRVQGFMMPVETDPLQIHFVLTPVPPSCPFCMPAGPEAMVEVRLKSGVHFSNSPIVVAGKFSVRNDDPRGVFYSLTEGVTVAPAH